MSNDRFTDPFGAIPPPDEIEKFDFCKTCNKITKQRRITGFGVYWMCTEGKHPIDLPPENQIKKFTTLEDMESELGSPLPEWY